jgi:hypothetical protein
MSLHVTRGRLSVFGAAPAGTDAGAPKSAAIPVGIMIRIFTIARLVSSTATDWRVGADPSRQLTSAA